MGRIWIVWGNGNSALIAVGDNFNQKSLHKGGCYKIRLHQNNYAIKEIPHKRNLEGSEDKFCVWQSIRFLFWRGKNLCSSFEQT